MDPHSFRHAIVCCVLTLSWTSYVSYALATNELTCVEDAVPNCTALITRCEEFEEDVCSSVTTIKGADKCVYDRQAVFIHAPPLAQMYMRSRTIFQLTILKDSNPPSR